MRSFHRRVLILLFALLQCVAPLLHAHAHAHVQGHGGIHLPGWTASDPHGQETAWFDAHHCDPEATVGLTPSLQPRVDVGPDTTGPLAWLPGALPVGSGTVPHSSGFPVLPGPAPHLIPLPGAPPAF